MTDKAFEYLDNPQLVQQIKDKLGEIAWPIHYGNVSVQLRDGRPTMAKLEVTIKLD